MKISPGVCAVVNRALPMSAAARRDADRLTVNHGEPGGVGGMDRDLDLRVERHQPGTRRVRSPPCQWGRTRPVLRKERVAAIGELRRRQPLVDDGEAGAPTRKRIGKETRRARMVGRRTRPLQTTGVKSGVAHAAEEGDEGRHLGKNLAWMRVSERVSLLAELCRQALGQVARDRPVSARGTGWIDGLVHQLHASLAVGERAILLGEGSGGQDHICQLGCLVRHDVLHDEKRHPAQRLARVVQVWFGQQWILADEVECLQLAAPHRIDHLCQFQARRRGQLGGPCLTELRPRLVP